MDLTPGVRRLALLLATLGVLALTFTGATASAQREQPACSNGIDDDADNSVDGDDAGCAGGSDDDESDSPYSGIEVITIPLPLVTLQGTVDAQGAVDVARLVIRAERGSKVRIRCSGRGCPLKQGTRFMLTSSLRLNKFERLLKAPMIITLKIAKPGQLGKYVRYKIRRNNPPVREDACLDQNSGKVRPCYVG